MKDKLLIFLGTVLLLVAGTTVYQQYNHGGDVIPPTDNIDGTATSTPQVVTSTNANPLFTQWFAAGPCPTIGGCSSQLKLFYDGKIEEDSVHTKTITQEQINTVISFIQQTGIMNKDCTIKEDQRPTDVDGVTFISIGGREQTATFPACNDDVQKIIDFIEKI